MRVFTDDLHIRVRIPRPSQQTFTVISDELCRMVVMHPEDKPHKQSIEFLCPHHFVQATDCLMIDEEQGTCWTHCTICPPLE